jgi:K+-sensing histidine kinase KdpD
MGLPISQAIIDAYGGCIDFENAAAGGSIVRVTLPAGDQMDQVRCTFKQFRDRATWRCWL